MKPKVTVDKQSRATYIKLNSNPIHFTEHVRECLDYKIIMDFDKDDRLVSIELVELLRNIKL